MSERTPFQTSEYRRRLDRTRERMRDAGLDALVVTDPANMNYLTGYESWSFYVHQCVVVTLDHDPVWVGREMDAKSAEVTTWLPRDHVKSYTDDYVQSPHDKHPMDYVARVVADLGYADRTLGVEMDAYYYTARSHARLTGNLDDATIEDATLLVNWVRLKKSDAELERMEQAAELAESGMRAAVDTIREGVRESDAAAAIYDGLISGTDAFGGDYPAIVPLMPSGDHTGTPHLSWSDREFDDGDPVIIELAGCKHRYHCPMARTLNVGEPTDAMQETADVVMEGLQAALDAVEPGVTAESVERVWRETIAKHGIEKESRLGYATGLGYPPDWGEHTVSLRPGDETVLEPGMAFHMIPGIWFDDFGVEISETFRVTNSGAETLADFDRDVFRV
ncbi:M24 family metallopeptidase [Halocalculus aciditolerans]|uniref:Ectoine hydrolase DoeA n=1 Tax=Halocalculus aciditolerans TaxID=1383812 RepID=A0A830FE14_9EURY|nr:M24 family metallopeptidase [Halocalculus aciditolerans]GGL65901.1 ectoine hydrolase DoeA [Halocalculus aciditolerans]